MAGAHIRSMDKAAAALKEAKAALGALADNTVMASVYELPYAFQNRDLLISQIVYLSAIEDYIKRGGRSRGSYLVMDPGGVLPAEGLPEDFRFSIEEDASRASVIQEVEYANGGCSFYWRPVRPIPAEDDWFENVWNAFMRDETVK